MFQRMMEWVLQDLENADPYVDDIIIGSNGGTWEEVIANHERDVRTVLNTLKVIELIVDPRKAHMFMKEVEFCGISSGRVGGHPHQENSSQSINGSHQRLSRNLEAFWV